MISHIQIGPQGQSVSFRLDWENRRWHSLKGPEEGDFPLKTMIDSKRFELYSDGTFAEVER